MKISLDAKFLLTAGATFVALVVVVALLNQLAGTAAASVGGAVAGAVAIKLFDKLEYTPSREIEFGAPIVSISWVYAATAGLLVMYGARIFPEIGMRFLAPAAVKSCGAVLAGVSALDWGAFILAGWLIGRIFPTHALSASALAGIAIILLGISDPDIGTTEHADYMLKCIYGGSSVEVANDVKGSLRAGMIAGEATRAFIAVIVARMTARRTLGQVGTRERPK